MRRKKVLISSEDRDRAELEMSNSLMYYDQKEYKNFFSFYSKIDGDLLPSGCFANFLEIYKECETISEITDYKTRRSGYVSYIESKIGLIPDESNRLLMKSWFSDVTGLDNDQSFTLASETFYKYQWLLKKEKINIIDNSEMQFKEKCAVDLSSDFKNFEEEDFISIYDSVDTYINNDGKESYNYYKTYTPLDNDIKPVDGDFMVIGARPSIGKTAMAIEMGLNNAKDGVKVAYFSFEMNFFKINKRIFNWYKGRLVHPSEHRIIREEEEFKNITSNFLCYEKYLTGEQLFLKMKKAVKQGCKLIIIDYLQLVKFSGMDEWGGLRKLTFECKKFAKENNVFVLSLSQVSRDSETMGLDLSTLFGGVSLEADTDIVVGIELAAQRESPMGMNNIKTVKLTALKNRDGERNTVYKTNVDYIKLTFEEQL